MGPLPISPTYPPGFLRPGTSFIEVPDFIDVLAFEEELPRLQTAGAEMWARENPSVSERSK